jgi:hypothetical protein
MLTASILFDSTPSKHEKWFNVVSVQTLADRTGDESLIFINAWNKWAEGEYREPGMKWAMPLWRRFAARLLKQRPPGKGNNSFAVVADVPVSAILCVWSAGVSLSAAVDSFLSLECLSLILPRLDQWRRNTR